MAEQTVRVGDYADQPVWFYAGLLADAITIEYPLLPHFTCGFFFFGLTWTPGDLGPLIRRLIECGCGSMQFHGNHCEEAHDLTDQIFVTEGYERSFGPDDTLMTASSDDSVLQTIHDLFCCSLPSDFENSGFLVFSFGLAEENESLRRLLADPDEAIRAAVAQDTSAP